MDALVNLWINPEELPLEAVNLPQHVRRSGGLGTNFRGPSFRQNPCFRRI